MIDGIIIIGGLIVWFMLGKVEKRLREGEVGRQARLQPGTSQFLFNIPKADEPWLRGAAHKMQYRIFTTPHAFERFGKKIEGYVGVYSCELRLRSCAPLLEEFIRICPRFAEGGETPPTLEYQGRAA